MTKKITEMFENLATKLFSCPVVTYDRRVPLSKDEYEYLKDKANVEIETEGKVFKKHILILPSRVANCKKWEPLLHLLWECDEALGRNNRIDSNGKLDITTIYCRVKGRYLTKSDTESRNTSIMKKRKVDNTIKLSKEELEFLKDKKLNITEDGVLIANNDKSLKYTAEMLGECDKALGRVPDSIDEDFNQEDTLECKINRIMAAYYKAEQKNKNRRG